MLEFSGIFAQQSIVVASSGSAPVVEGVTFYDNRYVITDHNVPMSATTVAGELLLIVFNSHATTTLSTPAGWTVIHSHDYTGSVKCYRKTADGTEGGTLALITTATGMKTCGQAYRISGWSSDTANIQFSEADNATATPPIPSLTPSWGSAPTLWLPFVNLWNQYRGVSAIPAGYTNLVGSELTSHDARIFSCRRTDPSYASGNVTLTASTPTTTVLFAVKGT